MPWNQPGSPGGNPWGGKGNRQGPPDLDEIVRNVQRRLSELFGRARSGGNGEGGGSGGSGGGMGGMGALLLVGVVLLGWLFSGFYIVEQGTAGVVLRFGRYVETTDPGLRWHWPWPIEQRILVNLQKVNAVEIGYRTTERNRAAAPVAREALMLTRDENIIDIQLAVQFDVKDPRKLLFNVSENMDGVVRSATESAVREVVGNSDMDFALTEGRADVANRTRQLLQSVLDRYDTGINVIAVEMQNAQPPAEVKPAFDDAVKAREDQERVKNEAQAYSNDIIPRARGNAARAVQEAEGHKAAVVARSQGEASRFKQVLDEYKKAPEVTRQRMYIETMERVYSNSTKIVIDQHGGSNLLYVPLDKILQGRGDSVPPVSDPSQAETTRAVEPRAGDRGRERSRTERGAP
jgi:membrane protease subunit HflK